MSTNELRGMARTGAQNKTQDFKYATYALQVCPSAFGRASGGACCKRPHFPLLHLFRVCLVELCMKEHGPRRLA